MKTWTWWGIRPTTWASTRALAVGCFAVSVVLSLGVAVPLAGASDSAAQLAARAASGNLSPEEAQRAARSAGVSPEEAADRLRARGVPEDRIRELLESEAPPNEIAEMVDVEESLPVDEIRIELAPEEIAESSQPEDDALVPFGIRLFETSPDRYRQPAYGPVDPDYPLGPGDGIVLDVWGDTVFRVERTLDREGGVNLPDVGRVTLAGLTLAEAERALRNRLGRMYSGLAESEASATTHLSVTLGDLRMVRVYVVGRARRPGAYDLTATSTVFHALFYAGGPTEQGSMRDVRVVRGGKEVARLDVYEYLRTGRRQGDVRLENDDTVFLPPAGPRVAIVGEVRQPALYELLPGESLADLVETAGGFTEKAFSGRIQVERILGSSEDGPGAEDRKLLDFAADAEGWHDALQDGDRVSVFPLNDRLRNVVAIDGEVRRPGTYELREGARLSDALRQAGGLLETAFLEKVEIVRTYEDERREQIAVDLAAVLNGDPRSDLGLMPRDRIQVHSIWDLRDEQEVRVYGAVRNPGAYELRENMSLSDLLLQAGGLTEAAYANEIEVSRMSPAEGEATGTTEVFRVPLGENWFAPGQADLQLKAWDNVFVREIPNFERQRNVLVGGEVRFPGTYSLRGPQETLADVIARAGGLKETAYLEGFALHRKKDEIGRIALDLRHALRDPSANDNVALVDGDSLFIPEEPKTVTVKGSVGYPTSLVYENGWSIGDYVSRAGGTTHGADRGQIRIVYSTGAAARVKKFWFDPEVLPGSTIVVPAEDPSDGVDWGNVFKDTTSILASLATVALVVDRVGQ